MNNLPDSRFWIPDEGTYNKIQKLKKYVAFIAGLPFSSDEDKQKASRIIFLIENINKPETFRSWNVCLDIFDRDIQYGFNKSKGIYWRTWSVYFEGDSLEIEASSKHTHDIFHYGDDFHYFGLIYFTKNIEYQRLFLETDIDEFVNDASNFNKYITESLNDIEIDIVLL
ncbi:MAG: hypothetical protein Q7U54_09165 [Bacteroidales bacterium]|nr:hypothetical protein [Bacteroidales bacterium]